MLKKHVEIVIYEDSRIFIYSGIAIAIEQLNAHLFKSIGQHVSHSHCVEFVIMGLIHIVTGWENKLCIIESTNAILKKLIMRQLTALAQGFGRSVCLTLTMDSACLIEWIRVLIACSYWVLIGDQHVDMALESWDRTLTDRQWMTVSLGLNSI